MMKIAILGAGLSGLALCWHFLKQKPSFSITVFDPKGIGGGASGISAGLLHSYAGAHAKLNRDGIEGMRATHKLLEVASQALGKPIAEFKGILRLAISEQQRQDFAQRADKHSDVDWLTIEDCQKLVPGIASHPGILIKSGGLVNIPYYLEGLWQACQAQGAILIKKKIQALEELSSFDIVVVAMGTATASFSELAHLPLKAVKGQILELSWPEELPPLPFPVSSKAYLAMAKNNTSCLAGATFEKNFSTVEPTPSTALEELKPKIEEIFPLLKDAKLLQCRAGIRASTPNHLPMMGKVNKRIWHLTGMGSKGLLYHALYAEKLVKCLSKC